MVFSGFWVREGLFRNLQDEYNKVLRMHTQAMLILSSSAEAGT